jgi:hypothetical protein
VLKVLFGSTLVHRLSFTAREAAGGLRPLEAELNLPGEVYSLGVRHRAATMAMDVSFDSAQEKLETCLGLCVPKRQLEELVVRATQDFEAFYEHQQDLGADQNAEKNQDKLLMLTTDGKGIVMRREALREGTRKKAEAAQQKLSTRLSPGEKRNRKRMAEVASVCELKPQARSPVDILPLPEERLDGAVRGVRPRPENKRVWASVVDSLGEVVEQCFDEALSRDPLLERTWVYRVDGNKDQLRIGKEIAASFGVELVIIVDFAPVWRTRPRVPLEGRLVLLRQGRLRGRGLGARKGSLRVRLGQFARLHSVADGFASTTGREP